MRVNRKSFGFFSSSVCVGFKVDRRIGQSDSHQRMRRANQQSFAQLLEHTGLRLAEIAARVGYRSEFAFSRASKLARGVSPTQCRRGALSRS